VDLSLLNRMNHVVGAGHHSGDRQGCIKGTRRGVLQQLEDWLHDEQGERFFWLTGFAGTGKSAIAQTFAKICFADGILGAGFFCSRESVKRSNVQLIIPTLAFQLAHRYPRFREELVKLLRTNPDVGQEHLSLQLEKLIVGPFEATQIQTLIIIDALDECDDKSVHLFLMSLSRHMDGIPNVKFFVTGRPVGDMAYGFFRKSPVYPIAKVSRLDDVERSLVDDDIKLILRTRLREHVKASGHCNPPKGWPSSNDIDILCYVARGSFICASKFVNLLTSHHDLTIETLIWCMGRINKTLEQRWMAPPVDII